MESDIARQAKTSWLLPRAIIIMMLSLAALPALAIGTICFIYLAGIGAIVKWVID